VREETASVLCLNREERIALTQVPPRHAKGISLDCQVLPTQTCVEHPPYTLFEADSRRKCPRRRAPQRRLLRKPRRFPPPSFSTVGCRKSAVKRIAKAWTEGSKKFAPPKAFDEELRPHRHRKLQRPAPRHQRHRLPASTRLPNPNPSRRVRPRLRSNYPRPPQLRINQNMMRPSPRQPQRNPRPAHLPLQATMLRLP